MSRRESLWLALLPIAVLVIVCARSADEERRDTAAPAPAVGGANATPIDTGMTSRTPDTVARNRPRP